MKDIIETNHFISDTITGIVSWEVASILVIFTSGYEVLESKKVIYVELFHDKKMVVFNKVRFYVHFIIDTVMVVCRTEKVLY